MRNDFKQLPDNPPVGTTYMVNGGREMYFYIGWELIQPTADTWVDTVVKRLFKVVKEFPQGVNMNVMITQGGTGLRRTTYRVTITFKGNVVVELELHPNDAEFAEGGVQFKNVPYHHAGIERKIKALFEEKDYTLCKD